MIKEMQSFENQRWKGTLMKEIVEDLKASRDVAEHPRDYVIRGEILASDLRALTEFPFEVSIDEEKGWLILGSGMQKYAAHSRNLESKRRPYYAKVSFHTHPIYDGQIMNAPSLDDLSIQLSRTHKGHNESIIGHPGGMLVFTYYLDTALRKEEQTEQYKKMHRALQQMKLLDDQKHNMLFLYAVRAQRKLFEDSGLLVFETTWDNTAGVEKILQMFRSATT